MKNKPYNPYSNIDECNNYNDIFVRYIDELFNTESNNVENSNKNMMSQLTDKIKSSIPIFNKKKKSKIWTSNQEYRELIREYTIMGVLYSLTMGTCMIQYTQFLREQNSSMNDELQSLLSHPIVKNIEDLNETVTNVHINMDIDIPMEEEKVNIDNIPMEDEEVNIGIEDISNLTMDKSII